MAYNYDDYYNRQAVKRNQRMETERRIADPVRYQPVTDNGSVATAGANLDGTPESARNRGRESNLAQVAASLANQSRRTANQGMAQDVAATRPGEQQRRAGLAQVLSTITPDQQNQNYGQLSRVLGTDAPPESLLGRTVEGGGLAGDQRDYFLQTGRAQTPEAARNIFNQERQNMGRGSGVAMTESGKIIRADDNFQYDAQRNIDNPELRAMVPQLAEANQQAISDPEQRALVNKALELGQMGIDLPEGTDLDKLTNKDIQRMSVKAGQNQAQQQYSKDYLQLMKTVANMTMPHPKFPEERVPITSDQAHQYVVNAIGTPPGQGTEADKAIQLALGQEQPQPTGAPAPEVAQAQPQSNFNLGSVIDGIRNTFGANEAQAAGPPPPQPTQAPPINMSRTAPIEGAAIGDGLPNIYEKFFGQKKRPTLVGSVIG